MATADPKFTLSQLPAEGCTLGDIVRRSVGRKAWAFLLEMVGDQSRPSVRQLQWFYITPRALVLRYESDGVLARATRKCLPIVERWNAGAWIAKGRRGSPIEPPVEIPPPATGYELVIRSLTHSMMIEPGDRKKMIYDLRFYSPATLAPAPPPPLLVKHDGPIEVTENRRGEQADMLRKIAAEECGEDWRSIRPKSRVVNAVLNRKDWDSNKRDTVLRALSWRKG